jgi:hypothetical protein
LRENTYTYTARSVDDPEQVVTFTLYDHSLSVGVGVPLEHVERGLQARQGEAEEESEYHLQPWLKPVAVSLVERGTHPFGVEDVDARVEEDALQVRAWFRTGGLRLFPITLIKGRVDNPEAAYAFVEELDRRKKAMGRPSGFLKILDYWAAWLLASFLMAVLLETWRRRGRGKAA